MKNKKRFRYSLLFCSFVLTPSLSNASGFAIVEQSVSGLGNAYAGAASVASDASTVYFNPAGMMLLEGRKFSAGLHAITPSAKFTNNNSTITTGGNGGDAGGTEFAPNVYYVAPIDYKTKFGLGINAPFGLSTEYDAGWVGRYHAVKSTVKTININPSIAFATDSPFSVGLGMNLQYMDAELTNAINFGTPSLDGYADVKGDSWALGYNFGVLYAPGSESRIGFSYRSQVKHKLGGTADFTVPQAVLAGNPLLGYALKDTDVTADVTLPESWSLSGYRQITKQWELLGEISFTKWSQLQELTIQFDNPYKDSSTEQIKFRNTYRYAIGLNFKPNNHFTYRAGFAYDEGAAQNATYRTPRIPDQNRTWLALGFGYKQNKVSFDLGYAHLFIDDGYINRTSTSAIAPADTLNGKYQLSVNILSAQFNYDF